MDKIIIKYLSGIATEQEKELLEKWLKDDPKNIKVLSNLKHTWSLEKFNSIPESLKNELTSSIEVNTLNQLPSFYSQKRYQNYVKTFAITISAAIILLFSFLFIQMRIDLNSYRAKFNTQLSFADIDYELYTPFGVKGRVTLPDGSIVWLNSGSKISVPPKFSGLTREVKFTGEGFFEVNKNPDMPMNITLSSGHKISIKGTTFNLSFYEGDSHISLLLLSGDVDIQDAKGKHIHNLVPNEKVVVDINNDSYDNTIPIEIMPVIGWKSGWLVFDETPMNEVFKKMERWYGQRINVKDSTVFSKKLTAKFHEESANQVFDLMRQIELINYKIIDSVAYIYDFKPYK